MREWKYNRMFIIIEMIEKKSEKRNLLVENGKWKVENTILLFPYIGFGCLDACYQYTDQFLVF